MTMAFDEFKKIIRDAEAKSDIKTSKLLTDEDLAIQWAISNIGERKGYPCEITPDEIWEELFELYRPVVSPIVDYLNKMLVEARRHETD